MPGSPGLFLRRHRRLLGVLAVCALPLSGARATVVEPGPAAATPHVTATLLASADAVRPGREILLGVRQRIIPHWHTYWKNPGDSGSPTTITWRLPEGVEAGDIRWPTPGRITLGPITNYGYENEVTLLTPVRLPETLPDNRPFVARATVSWLVCREECIPEEVELAIRLPVLGAEARPGPGDPAIEQALARLPRPAPGPASFRRTADGGLRLHLDGLDIGRPASAWFYPDQWGAIDQSATQVFSLNDGRLTLELPPGETPPADGERLRGVLALTPDGGADDASVGYEISADHAVIPAAHGGQPAPVMAMALAFLGGILLNLMPCVFPVLSIKALSLLGHTGHTPARTHRLGWAYAAGVLASFALLALALIALRAGGQAIGWGFQYQSPVFVVLVAYLMFAVGLNLSGLFTIGASVAGVGSSLAGRGGYTGSFFTGVLAAVVATPCTAPFMGAAIGYAVSQPTAILFAVFLSLGLGLALPYLLLSAWPRLQRLLPRPGPWMERLRQTLAFPMYGAAIWLVWVLARQAGADAVPVALTGMLLIALAGWLYSITRQGCARVRLSGTIGAGLAVATALLGGALALDGWRETARDAASTDGGAQWRAYSAERLAELRQNGTPVFVNMTAAWCISCLVNERVALRDADIVDTFEARGIAYLKGDWTNRDPEISRYLGEFGRGGVPLYVYYPANGGEPVVLPQLLTPRIVRDHLFPAAGVSPPPDPKESS